MGGISSISLVITHPKQGGGARGGFYCEGRKETKRKRVVGFLFFFFLEKEFECFASFSCVADVGTSCYLFRKG